MRTVVRRAPEARSYACVSPLVEVTHRTPPAMIGAPLVLPSTCQVGVRSPAASTVAAEGPALQPMTMTEPFVAAPPNAAPSHIFRLLTSAPMPPRCTDDKT